MSQPDESKPPRDPAALSTLIEISRELDSLNRPNSSRQSSSFRRAQLYRRAAAMGVLDPTELTNFLVPYLLNDCVHMDDGDAKRTSLDRSSLREILKEWLDALPENILWRVRSAILATVIGQLNLKPTVDTLYLLASIGLRDKQIVQALQQIRKTEEDLWHAALRLMVALGVEGVERKWVQEQIDACIAKSSISLELQRAITLLGADSAVDHLYQIGLKEESQLFIVYSELGYLSDRAPGDCVWQNRVCDAILGLANQRTNGWPQLLFTGEVIERCHTPRMIEKLCASLPNLAALGHVQVDRIAQRIERLMSPSQVEGTLRADRGNVARVLRERASISSGQTIGSMTAEARSKRDAWNLALTLGTPDVVDWVANAVDNEENIYQQHGLMEAAAVLSVSPLPSRAVSLLSSRDLSFSPGRDDPETLAFLGAARLAASSLRRESLQLLLGAEGLIDGHPFKAPVDHAAELATWMIEHENSSVLTDIVEALSSPRPMASSIATSAIALLGRRSMSLTTNIVEILERIVCDDNRTWYLRAEAVVARSSKPGLSASFEMRLAELCDHEDEQLRIEAAHALIREGLLDRHRLAIERCAFRSSGVARIPSERLTNYEAYLIGTLAALEPDTYGDAAVLVIESDFTFAADEAIRAIKSAKREDKTISDLVSSAIVKRISKYESSSFANMSLFESLSEMNPSALLNEAWENIWDRWMANSRQALADCLPGIVGVLEKQSAKDRAVWIAKALIGDSIFGVRRSAARALARLDQESLKETCEAFMDSGSIIFRERAAEMAGWLPFDDQSTLDNAILRRTAHDSERRVRSASEVARKDARRRFWAAEHMRVVLENDNEPNSWVLTRYASGVALANVGDDQDISTLSNHARRADVPPNVRHWFRQILKALDRKWKETTRKWPDTWLPKRGIIEKLNGLVVIGVHSHPAQFSLWVEPPAYERDLARWGGAIYLDDSSKFSILQGVLQDASSETRICIDGRSDGRVLVVNVSDNEVLVIGSGPYPAGGHR